ncbi:N-acetylmuramoyl-L-alanine amidase [Clostridium sp. Ade.TY]|uniref:N-acetylmuramoyl-L-alanine amidase n=1 Tax=Clostridium sp. Ade.TY TaxID=1391647 RepID=UPI0003FA748A|nr:N-acetylmuramoyl-L-alanine amidase [Clostridium sp. Ade.TY]
MKIAIRAGHTFSVRGAKGILDETTENRKVKDAVIKYLKIAKVDVVDVTPSDSYNTVGSELAYGVNKANELMVDLFVSCHFNKAYDKYDGAIGSEVWTYSDNFIEAKRVVDNLGKLGFKNRGVKNSTSLYELRNTNMKAMIIEVCFVEATKDVELYKALGYDKIGKKIAEGIIGKEIIEEVIKEPDKDSTSAKPNTNISKKLWEKSISGQEVKNLQLELNNQFNRNLNVDGYFGEETLDACVTLRKGSSGNITKLVQKRLLYNKYSLGPYGADGTFGEVTEKVIRKFQKDNGLLVDGIVGKNTWKKLYEK